MAHSRKSTTTKVVIIRKDMTTVTFEKADYKAAAAEVARMAFDPSYNLAENTIVYIGDGTHKPSEYSVGELARDVCEKIERRRFSVK
jgi:hypothetical protein